VRGTLDAMAEWLDAEEAGLWEPYVLSTLNLFTAIDAELKRDFDIIHLDYGILNQLMATPGGVRMSDLASMFGVDPSVITYRVTRMERRGLVERVSVPSDGRGVLAVVTPDGKALMEEAAPRHVATVRRLFLSHVDRSDVKVLTRAFERIRADQAEGAR
jgi:DNA-binding MarR family transcriptional regulator